MTTPMASGKRTDPPPSDTLRTAMANADADPDAAQVTLKEVGNACYGEALYTAALRYFSEAINRHGGTAALHSNRSAAYLQSGLRAGPSLALRDADAAVALDGSWAKAHLRRGDALFKLGRHSEAVEAYDECLARNPSCDNAARSRALCAEAVHRTPDRRRQDPTPAVASPVGSATSSGMPSAQHTHVHSVEEPGEDERSPGELAKCWSRDAVPTERTGFCPASTLKPTEEDRSAGQRARAEMLATFRRKVANNTELQGDLARRSEATQLEGTGFNYKAARPRTGLRTGTDEVGRAISSDAFATYSKREAHW